MNQHRAESPIHRRTPILCFALLLVAPGARAASFPPGLHFQSLETDKAVVHYHEGLESQARTAAALATEILALHEARYGHSPARVQIVLSDVQDDPNGFAATFPYPLVYIRAAAPDGSDEFGNYDSWLRLVLTHELAHIVHLDQARGPVRAARKIFGRAPFLFPNALSPTWMIEGLATYEETRDTSFGRGRSSDFRMIRRMAVLEGAFPEEDQAVAGFDPWPGGDAAYAFGEGFLQDLQERFSEDTLPEMARVHSGRIVPYLDELTCGKVTGAACDDRWQEWRSLEEISAQHEAERIAARGVTTPVPLTSRGILQTGPRFSPDGERIAYTSHTLSRFPSIRLVGRDGRGDRSLCLRNGGTGLSWTPDGTQIVFDEPDIHAYFETFSDLRVVDVASGRVRSLTRGLRARSPDVSPDGMRIVYARRLRDRMELGSMGIHGEDPKDITRSEPGTQWNDPHWSPGGERVVASRFREGGHVEIVLVEPSTGAVEELTSDRARNVEPVFTHDGSHILFRSDRDGVSNLYALRLSDRALLRLTNVVGGAFDPDPAPGDGEIALASYSSRGYDVALLPLDLEAAREADPFRDPYPPSQELPPPFAGAARHYSPGSTLLPRYWTPYFQSVYREWQYGLTTSAQDPLYQHLYAFEAHRGSSTGRTGGSGVYVWDRYFPTFEVAAEDTTQPEPFGALFHKRDGFFTIVAPLERSLRSSESVSVSYRRQRETFEGAGSSVALDLGGIQVAWTLSSAKLYPLSISPVDGWGAQVAFEQEARSLGSQVALGKLTADTRAYLRLFGEESVLAVRLGGGTTLGRSGFHQSYVVGGFPVGALTDIVDTNFTVLRGYPDDAFFGRNFAHLNVEYRFPLAFPERGYRSLPVFIRHLHASLFTDAASAWSGPLLLSEIRTSAGVALGADTAISQGLPVTGTVGIARGFSKFGETRVYARLGLSF